jgi:uncharacterized repeat protein (TIGR03803 family)
LSFDGADGSEPYAGLVEATNGDLYGTTFVGGANNLGTVFKITPSGKLTTLYTFCSQPNCADGGTPAGGLVQDTNGTLYGTTVGGGAYFGGTVFKVTPSGTLTTLYSFCPQPQANCPDGSQPQAGLVEATNGDLYGTTLRGGSFGTLFKITPRGVLTTLYSFCCTNGEYPIGSLVEAANGDLYGTTPVGGAHGVGTVFKITLSGTLTTLYSFCSQAGCADGSEPYAGLVEATNGDLYGTTCGGAGCSGAGYTQGTLFKITPSGELTTLYTFCSQPNCADGGTPVAGLVQATDGELYGTTTTGGANNKGTVFKITPSGTLATLYSFCSQASCADGFLPYAELVQDTNGTLYGTTAYGGAYGYGTAFSLSVGLGPFVKTLPTSGKAGAVVEILAMPPRDPQILKYFSMGMMTNLSWDCPKTEPLALATPTISKGIPSITMFRPTALELAKSCSLLQDAAATSMRAPMRHLLGGFAHPRC